MYKFREVVFRQETEHVQVMAWSKNERKRIEIGKKAKYLRTLEQRKPYEKEEKDAGGKTQADGFAPIGRIGIAVGGSAAFAEIIRLAGAGSNQRQHGS